MCHPAESTTQTHMHTRTTGQWISKTEQWLTFSGQVECCCCWPRTTATPTTTRQTAGTWLSGSFITWQHSLVDLLLTPCLDRSCHEAARLEPPSAKSGALVNENCDDKESGWLAGPGQRRRMTMGSIIRWRLQRRRWWGWLWPVEGDLRQQSQRRRRRYNNEPWQCTISTCIKLYDYPRIVTAAHDGSGNSHNNCNNDDGFCEYTHTHTLTHVLSNK